MKSTTVTTANSVNILDRVFEYGRWNDLLAFENSPSWPNVLSAISSQLNTDRQNFAKGQPISLLAVWLPVIDTGNKDSKRLGRKIASHLNLSEKAYGKVLKSLRSYKNIVNPSDNRQQIFGDPAGTPKSDTLTYVGKAESLIEGRGLGDILKGGKDIDTIYGDYAEGENSSSDGNDVVYGNQGNDIIYGGGGNDTVYGGANDDVIYGGSGNDRLQGDDGNDQLYGGIGNDQLYGGKNNDILRGGSQTANEIDSLTGGSGSDIFELTNSSRTANAYRNNLNNDYAVIVDWRQGGTQDKIYLASEAKYKILYQFANGSVNILEGTDLIARVDLGASSGLTKTNFLANVEANTIFI